MPERQDADFFSGRFVRAGVQVKVPYWPARSCIRAAFSSSTAVDAGRLDRRANDDDAMVLE
jgi:hypothetical protein